VVPQPLATPPPIETEMTTLTPDSSEPAIVKIDSSVDDIRSILRDAFELSRSTMVTSIHTAQADFLSCLDAYLQILAPNLQESGEDIDHDVRSEVDGVRTDLQNAFADIQTNFETKFRTTTSIIERGLDDAVGRLHQSFGSYHSLDNAQKSLESGYKSIRKTLDTGKHEVTMDFHYTWHAGHMAIHHAFTTAYATMTSRHGSIRGNFKQEYQRSTWDHVYNSALRSVSNGCQTSEKFLSEGQKGAKKQVEEAIDKAKKSSKVGEDEVKFYLKNRYAQLKPADAIDPEIRMRPIDYSEDEGLPKDEALKRAIERLELGLRQRSEARAQQAAI